MSQPRRFLRFAGRLWENMEFEPEAGWETETVHRLPEPDDRYRVVLRDADGRSLVAVTPGFERDLCRPTYGGMERERLVAYVPLHPGARTVELRRDEQVLHTAGIARRPPGIRITRLEPPDGESVTLAWAAEHELPLTYHVVFVDGRGRAFTVARGLERSDLTVDTSRYPGGAACRLAVMATDGLRSAHALSPPFRIPDKPPRVVLLTPQAGQTLPPDQPLPLSGHALDLAGAMRPAEALRWLVDGVEVARGCLLYCCPAPEPGEHRVTLRVEGEHPAAADATIRVRDRTPAEEQWRHSAAALGLLRPAAPPAETG